VMYQHGNPGSARSEVPSRARDELARAGFAVIGFTDPASREITSRISDPMTAVTTQIFTLLSRILRNRRVPDYWAQANAEQIAFLRLIESLGDLDLLPLDEPDGVRELDVEAPLGYVGISEGANLAGGFLPYAPEIGAAVLVAGGARLAELLIHQEAQDFLRVLPMLFPSLEPAEVWVGLALFQTAFDRQDAHNHARYLHRDPLPIDGFDQRASVLLIAGLGDRLVPNSATNSLAWQLGPLPQLTPVAHELTYLPVASGPLSGNLDARTTGAYVQLVPFGIEGVAPSPGCVPPSIPAQFAGEGHFCAQLAEESRRQRAKFLYSALRGGAPVIDPM
jgi:hypothetical protein